MQADQELKETISEEGLRDMLNVKCRLSRISRGTLQLHTQRKSPVADVYHADWNTLNVQTEQELKESMSEEGWVPIFVCMVAWPGVACPLHVFEPRYRYLPTTLGLFRLFVKVSPFVLTHVSASSRAVFVSQASEHRHASFVSFQRLSAISNQLVSASASLL